MAARKRKLMELHCDEKMLFNFKLLKLILSISTVQFDELPANRRHRQADTLTSSSSG